MIFSLKAPKFWDKKNHPASMVLRPLGWLYGLGVRVRFLVVKPYRVKLPVICVGNFTLGGGGKTPLVIEIAKLLLNKGHKPVFLTRGYGGTTKGPHLVDLLQDSAVDVGDEPLILAQTAPVVVSADRPAGARFIEAMNADVILMDDGFQNPTLAKDLSLVVVDETSGIGNGQIFPAGPLRASLALQFPKTDVLVINGPAPARGKSEAVELERVFKGEILRCDLVAAGDVRWLKGAKIRAMTGIARPHKFYASLERLGAKLVETISFPDHHMFSETEAAEILREVGQEKIPIVMTQKDWVRLPDGGTRGRLRRQAKVLEIALRIDRPEQLSKRLEKAISSVAQYSD